MQSNSNQEKAAQESCDDKTSNATQSSNPSVIESMSLLTKIKEFSQFNNRKLRIPEDSSNVAQALKQTGLINYLFVRPVGHTARSNDDVKIKVYENYSLVTSKISLENYTLYEFLLKLELERTLEHPMLLKFVGIAFSSSGKDIKVYRQSEQTLYPIPDRKSMTPTQKVDFMKQIVEFITFLGDNEILFSTQFYFQLLQIMCLSSSNDIIVCSLKGVEKPGNNTNVMTLNAENAHSLFYSFIRPITIQYPFFLRNYFSEDASWTDQRFLKFSNYLRNFSDINEVNKREAKFLLRGFKLTSELKYEHCNSMVYEDKGKKYMQLVYSTNMDEINSTTDEENLSFIATTWNEDGKTNYLLRYIKNTVLSEVIKKKPQYWNNQTKIDFIYNLVDFLNQKSYHSCRLGVNTVYIDDVHEFLPLDFIPLTANNYKEFSNQYTAPECDHIENMSLEDLKRADIYSVGALIYEIFVGKLQVDTSINRIIVPKVEEKKPSFWKELAHMCLQKNPFDRPTHVGLIKAIKTQQIKGSDLLPISPLICNKEDMLLIPISKQKNFTECLAAFKKDSSYKFLALQFDNNYITKDFHTLAALSIQMNAVLKDNLFLVKYVGFTSEKNKTTCYYALPPDFNLKRLLSHEKRGEIEPRFTTDVRIRLIKEIAEYLSDLHKHGIAQELHTEVIWLDSSFHPRIVCLYPTSIRLRNRELYQGPENDEGPFNDSYAFGSLIAKIFGAKKSNGRLEVSQNTPPKIEALIRKCWSLNPLERPRLPQIVTYLEQNTFKLQSLSNFNLDETSFSAIENESKTSFKYIKYESKGNCELVDSGASLQCAMSAWGVQKYSRENKTFTILFNDNTSQDDITNCIEELETLDLLNVFSSLAKQMLRGFKKLEDYQGKHCIVTAYENEGIHLIVKTYENKKLNEYHDLFSFVIGSWYMSGNTYYLLENVDSFSLNDILGIDEVPNFWTESFKKEFIGDVVKYFLALSSKGYHSGRISLGNMFLDEDLKFHFLDFIPLTADNYKEYLNAFSAPECEKFEQCDLEKSDVYAIGLVIYALLFGQLETDESTKRIKVPSFEGKSGFWSELVQLCLRKNPIDRPTLHHLNYIITKGSVDEEDRISISTNFVNLSEYQIINPIGDDNQIEILHATNKQTNKRSTVKRIVDIENPEEYIRKKLLLLKETQMKLSDISIIGYSYEDHVVYWFMDCEAKFSLHDAIYLDSIRKSDNLFNDQAKQNISIEIAKTVLSSKGNNKDLKPENILIMNDMTPLIVDFSSINNGIPNLLYTAPEVFEMKPDPEKSLIYSLASTIAAIYGGGRMEKIKGAVQRGIRPSISLRTPENVRRIINKCWSHNPSERPSINEIIESLQSPVETSETKEEIQKIEKIPESDLIIKENISNHRFDAEISSNNEKVIIEELPDEIYSIYPELSHPHLMKLKCISDNNKIITEHIGATFEDKSNEPINDFLLHLLQISSSMDYLHKNGIIHLNLTPKSIMIRPDNTVAVSDFTFAKFINNYNIKNTLQKDDSGFDSPEIRNSMNYSFSTDVFSFGLIIVHHFSPESLDSLIQAIMEDKAIDLSFINNKELVKLTQFCLNVDPTSRPSFEVISRYLFSCLAPENEELKALVNQQYAQAKKLGILAGKTDIESINEYGKLLLTTNHYEDAFRVFLQGAELGCGRCMNNLFFLSRNVIKKVITNDTELSKQSAEKGEVYGLLNEGYIRDMNKEYKKAEELYRQASQKGNTMGTILLGYLYERNHISGVSEVESFTEAIRLFSDAAYKGNSYAQVKYGKMVKNNMATDKEGHDAKYFFRLSAFQKNAFGCHEYAQYIDDAAKKQFYKCCAKEFGYDSEIDPLDFILQQWEYFEQFHEEVCANYIGSLLNDAESTERYEYLQSYRLGFDQI